MYKNAKNNSLKFNSVEVESSLGMARQQDNFGNSFQTTSFYKYQSASSSSSFTNEDFVLTPPAKSESYTTDVIRCAQVMFPEFFVKTTSKGLYMYSNDTVSSRVGRTGSNGSDKSYCKLDERIKIWFVKEYGLVMF